VNVPTGITEFASAGAESGDGTLSLTVGSVTVFSGP